MRTRTVTERIGERVADVDWNYAFIRHFDCLCADDARRAERCARAMEWLHEMEAAIAAGETIEATTDGGWPRFGWGRVIDVGMYDGWPYWRPVPSFLLTGTLGAEWHAFSEATDIRKATP